MSRDTTLSDERRLRDEEKKPQSRSESVRNDEKRGASIAIRLVDQGRAESCDGKKDDEEAGTDVEPAIHFDRARRFTNYASRRLCHSSHLGEWSV
jgi:hypothetical protein